MLLYKDKHVLENFSVASSLEWLETNGLGGWAGSSLCGCNTRRYHGLLMAAIIPPADRMLLVSKLDELEAAKALWNTTKKAELVIPVLVDLLEEKWDTSPRWGSTGNRSSPSISAQNSPSE